MPFINSRIAKQIQRRTKNYTYTDEAYYIALSGFSTLSDDGKRISTTTSTSVNCSFTDKPSTARWTGYINIDELAAEFRGEGFLPEVGAIFCLTHRFSSEVTERMFSILAVQDRGDFGFVCAVKAIPN